MKNIPLWSEKALSLRLRALRCGSVAAALSPFEPVGWAGMRTTVDGGTHVENGGVAVLNGPPATEDTIFRVASISKLFVAAAAMRLVARGKLALDGPVSDVLGIPSAKTITLRQLLSHTAGLNDHAAYDAAISAPDMPPLEAVLAASFTGHAPGTRFRYSNLGAGVAGMMVEAASGLFFDDFIRQEFFLPYGIDATFHPQRIQQKERMADCYRVPGQTLAYDAQAIARQPLEEKPDPAHHYAIPAGKLMISARDLAASLVRLYQQDSALFALQNHVGSVRCDARRGLGAAYIPAGILRANHAYWGHQGTAYGALCEAWIDPADQTCAVLLTNGIRLRSFAPLYSAGQSGLVALLNLDR